MYVSIDVLSSFFSPLRTRRLSAFKHMHKKRCEPPKEFTFLPDALTFKIYIFTIKQKKLWQSSYMQFWWSKHLIIQQ